MDRLYDSPPSEQDNIPEDEIFEEQSQTFEEETWEDETDPYEEAEEITSDHDSRNTFDAQAPEQSTHRFFKRKKNRKDSVEEPSFEENEPEENELEKSDPQSLLRKKTIFRRNPSRKLFRRSHSRKIATLRMLRKNLKRMIPGIRRMRLILRKMILKTLGAVRTGLWTLIWKKRSSRKNPPALKLRFPEINGIFSLLRR